VRETKAKPFTSTRLGSGSPFGRSEAMPHEQALKGFAAAIA
jgi:hypothetical protein